MIIVKADQLTKAYKIASQVTNKDAINPIVSNIVLRAEHGQLKVEGTNLKRSIRVSIPIDQEEAPINQGPVLEVAVDSDKLKTVIGRLKKGSEVMIETDLSPSVVKYGKDATDNRLILSSGKSRFTVAGMGTEDFPPIIPEIGNAEDSSAFTCSPDALKTALKRTLFSTTDERFRFNLSSVKCEKGPDSTCIVLVSTDGRRLSRAVLPPLCLDRWNVAPEPKGWDQIGYCLPMEAGKEIFKSIVPKNIDFSVSVTFETKRAWFTWAETDGLRFEYATTLNEYNFPPYVGILPEPGAPFTAYKVQRDTLLEAFKEGSLFAHPKTRLVDVKVFDGVLTVEADNAEGDLSEGTCPVLERWCGLMNKHGELVELNVSVNAAYAIEYLGTLEKGSQVGIHIYHEEGAIYFHTTGHLYIQMPMNAKKEEEEEEAVAVA